MNHKHRKTIDSIFNKPVPRSLKWSAVKSLLLSLGCEYSEGKGSRRLFRNDGEILHIHEPHPENAIKEYAVVAVRDFLVRLGFTP